MWPSGKKLSFIGYVRSPLDFHWALIRDIFFGQMFLLVCPRGGLFYGGICFSDQQAKLPWALSAPRWGFRIRERAEGRKNRPGNIKEMPKPLLEADAPCSGAHEGPRS